MPYAPNGDDKVEEMIDSDEETVEIAEMATNSKVKTRPYKLQSKRKNRKNAAEVNSPSSNPH